MRCRVPVRSGAASREPHVMLPMRASCPFQNKDCICRTSSHKQGSHQVEVVAVSREWVEPHRAFDPRYGFPGITQEGEVDAALNDESRIIWIERKRAL